MAQALLGDENRLALRNHRRFAVVLLGSGEVSEARRTLRETLDVAERVWGVDHTEVADILVDLGSAERRSGDLDAAERCWDRAARIRTVALGPDCVRTRTVADSLDGVRRSLAP
jgi:hypothetical protein